MPKHVLAAVGFDALCHCMEAYTSKISQPFTDALALYAIDLIAHNLVDVYKGRGTQESWEKITLASTIVILQSWLDRENASQNGGISFAANPAAIQIPETLSRNASGKRRRKK